MYSSSQFDSKAKLNLSISNLNSVFFSVKFETFVDVNENKNHFFRELQIEFHILLIVSKFILYLDNILKSQIFPHFFLTTEYSFILDEKTIQKKNK